MKINGYSLTFDPESLEDSNDTLFTEMKVPFGDQVIFDLDGTAKSITMGVILVDNEILDVQGMFDSYKLVHLEFGELNGFMYVTKYGISWIKQLDNRQIASMQIEGYFAGNNMYLKLGEFSDTQKTDFTITSSRLLCVPEAYTSKVSETPDYEITNTTETGSHLLYYISPTDDILFKAEPDIFTDGCIKLTQGGSKCYYEPRSEGNIIVDTNLLKHQLSYNTTNIFQIYAYDGSTLLCTISDGSNYVLSGDRHIKLNPFTTEVKANHTKYIFKANRDFVEIGKSPSNITHTSKNYYIGCKPDANIGDKELTTANPATMMIDNLIAAGTPGTTINYDLTPMFIKYTTGDTYVTGMFTTASYTHPTNAFTANTERNYLNFNQIMPIYSPSSEWTLSTFTAATNGSTMNGIANYVYSTTANATATVSKTITYDGYYDVYLMASNYTTYPVGTYEFYLNTVLTGTTSQLTWTTGDTKANFVYLGNHDLSAGSNTFRIKLKTGRIALFYLMIVPTELEAMGCAYQNGMSALLDTHEAYELGGI